MMGNKLFCYWMIKDQYNLKLLTKQMDKQPWVQFVFKIC